MRLLLLLSALVFFLASSTSVSAIDMTDRDFETEDSLWSLYERWMSHYNLSRDLDEKQKRFNVFNETARYIHDFNKRKHSHKLRLYHFADLTIEEFHSTYTGYLSGSCGEADEEGGDGDGDGDETGSRLSQALLQLSYSSQG